MQITAVCNQKGGVGKTATVHGLGGALAEFGRRVVVVDLDPQGHLTAAHKRPHAEGDATLAAALAGEWEGPIEKLLTACDFEGPGSIELIATTPAMFLVGRALDQMRAREHRLGRLLRQLEALGVDHVVIDCPPTLDILTDNALACADGLVIPVQTEDTTIRALRLLLSQIAAVDGDLRDRPLHLHGLVVSLVRRPLPLLAQSVLAQLEALDGLPILATVAQSITIQEAPRAGKTVVEYAPDTEYAAAYREIARVVDNPEGQAA